MGETTSSVEVPLTQKIKQVNQLEDPLFGKITIYHFTEPPYEYLMEHKKTYVNDKQRLTADLSRTTRLKNIQHPNVAKIYHTEVTEDVQLCIKHDIMHTYTNYYNFTLEKAIQKKKYTRHLFSQGDLLYIGKALTSFLMEMRKYGISKGNYRTSEVFLSPEGYVKLYLLGVEEENRHSCYYTVLTEMEKMREYLLAPEQLASLAKLEMDTKFDQYKADLFAIGLVLVQLITLDHANYYFDYERLQFMAGKVYFMLDGYTSTRYSQAFVNLLKNMLHPDPFKRIEIQECFQLFKKLNQRDRPVYCIRLEADPNPDSEKTIQQPKRKIMLSRISKMTPKPIETLSASNSFKPISSLHSSNKKTEQ